MSFVEEALDQTRKIKVVVNDTTEAMDDPDNYGLVSRQMLLGVLLGIYMMLNRLEEYLHDQITREKDLRDALAERNQLRNENYRLKQDIASLRSKYEPRPDPSLMSDRVKFFAAGARFVDGCLTMDKPQKIEAIRLLRDETTVETADRRSTCMGLADAKNMVEAFIESSDFDLYRGRVNAFVLHVRRQGDALGRADWSPLQWAEEWEKEWAPHVFT